GDRADKAEQGHQQRPFKVVKLLPALRRNPVGRVAGLLLAAFSLLAILGLHLPLPLLVLGLGSVGMALAWRGLKR
ncbi:hypothetical protein ACVBEH_10595, partial [Roseateles sp. GG27B]